MDRIREARRTTMAANGLTRRRHRTNSLSLRLSPEEDGAMELQEPTRLRDRGSGKKDRDRDRDRERERDRLGRNKRRRGDRLMHGGREDGVEDTSDESINDEEDDDDEDAGGVGGGGGGSGGNGSVRMLPLNPSSLSSSSLTNHHRKSFPPAKVFRPAPPTTWKAADEMIGVSVPRKARSASTKRSHECWASSGGGIIAEQNHRQPSTSPVRAAAAPPSPSSSNASVRKKIKPNGGVTKFKPPKSSTKSSSSAQQEEIEIEIAEVLYGMMRQPQSQGNSKQEINDSSIKLDSRDTNNHNNNNNNKSSGSDGKSRISSPPQNSSSSATPVSAVAPKRKRPRPVKNEENPVVSSIQSSPVSSTTKVESDQPVLMKSRYYFDRGARLLMPEEPESNASPDSNSKALAEESEKGKDIELSKDVVSSLSPKKESHVQRVVDDDCQDVKATKANQTTSESENQREEREEKFQIDLMAPPPTLRSSPERDIIMENNTLVANPEKDVKHVAKVDEKSHRMDKDEVSVAETERLRAKADENESQKAASVQRERGIDLQLELEKSDKVDNSHANGAIVNKKQHQNIQRQQQQQHQHLEKNVQSNSLPLPNPMSVPSWPGALPSMGYMTPLQGVVSMDGTTIPSAAIPQPPHHLFNQPRPKKCATHCYIARNILYHQQIARMNPFWPAAAGSASLYGAKPGNLSVVPPTELHGNVPGRAANSTQDKGHNLTMFPGHIGKDKVSQPANVVDNSSRKQILLQQTLPPGAAPSNILHGPAFIFPMNQQQAAAQAAAAAAAASVRPGSVKSLPLPVTSNGPSSSTSNSAQQNTSGAGAGAATPTMSFTYPNMPGNETQYLAILQNNAYPFPIPAHVGAPPTYRGNPAQAFPFFNGSFYSSQMIHPSQIQQQQLPAQSQQSQHGHQNTSMSTGSSSSQKHPQNQQQKPHNANGSNGGGSGSLQGFPVSKNPPSQPLQQQLQQQLHQQQQQLHQQQQRQQQQLQNHHSSNLARHVESEMGSEESPSSADSRHNRATMNMNIYSQNFAMPMQAPNFALMTHTMTGAASNGSHSEKKQPPQQHSGPKVGGETSPAFTMPFASINGAAAATGLDLSSIAQNHSIMQSNHNFQIMAAAQATAQLRKSYQAAAAEEGKNVVNSSNLEEDRKTMSGKIPASVGQSIAFARPDVSDPSMTSLAGNNVIDSSGRSLNLGSASSRATSVPASGNTNAAGAQQQQMQRNQQQILQLQKQNQFAAAAVAAARNKTPSTSNGNIYSENHASTSSLSTKFPNAVSAFPQSLVQSNNTAVTQSSQWKTAGRATNTSQSPPTMASTPSSSIKNPTQQQARSQQAHTQISFAANPKSSTTSQVQPANSTQSPSPVMVGSPTNSSMSKNTGSPRTTTSTSNNKTSQTSSLSSQQPKNSPTAPARKSSPVGGRNVPSILSGPQITPSSSSGSKSQLQQQQQQHKQQQHQQQQHQPQQQMSKQNLQQAQLFFSNPYIHSQQVSQTNSPTSTTSAATGYYLQRRGGPEQVQRQGSSGNSSNGAAANNSKSTPLPTQGLLHPSQFGAMPPSGNHHHQFVPAGFSYVHPAPTAVQVKPAEQKQPAGE